jgi:uncharacterized protein (TIGR03118 family)
VLMKLQVVRVPTIRLNNGTLFALVLCLSSLAGAQHFSQTNLSADVAGVAANTDSTLINPWGLARGTTGPWWISSNGNGQSHLFDGTGAKRALVVNVPSATGGVGSPTGTVFNASPNFSVSQAASSAALFLFATEDGTISGWDPNVDVFNAIVTVNHNGSASYTGLTIAEVGDSLYLYAANFLSGNVDVFNGAFQPVQFSEHPFQDPLVPKDYAPFNVQNIGQNIYVTFAAHDGSGKKSRHGAGLGYVDVFNGRGKLLQRLGNGPWMNAPWGVSVAGGDFGEFSHAVLVGNLGSGNIAAFDPISGDFIGLMKDLSGNVIAIDGLWALGFGDNGSVNSGAAAITGPFNALYFTAGPQQEQHGLFGYLAPSPAEQNRDEQ